MCSSIGTTTKLLLRAIDQRLASPKYSPNSVGTLLMCTRIAGVTPGVMRPFVTNTEWSSENTTHADELWKALAPNVGMVAVDNDFGRKMDLYATEQFPWDQSKGIYMLEGYHSLHCLVGTNSLHVAAQDLIADSLKRCTFIERSASSNKAFHRPLLCITTSTVSTHSERMQSVQPTTRSDLQVVAWRDRRIRKDSPKSSAAIGTSCRDGLCRIQHVSRDFLMTTPGVRHLTNGGGAQMIRRIYLP